MASPVVHFEILGKDGTKLQNFYKKLFDWKIEVHEPYNYGLVAPAGAEQHRWWNRSYPRRSARAGYHLCSSE